MNDDVEIEKLGLKDLKFLKRQIKKIESQLDAILEEGFEKELVPEPWQDSDKRYGYLHNPDLFKQFLGLSKLLTRYEKRRRILEGIPDYEEPRMGLSPECQDAFDLGVAWAATYRGTVNGAKGKLKYKRMEQLMLLEAERLWKLKKTKGLSRDQMIDRLCKLKLGEWVVIGGRLGFSYTINELAKVKTQTATEYFKHAVENNLIEMPEGAARSGRPKK